MSGGKGSSQTTSVAVPEYIEAAAQRNLNKAEAISQLGYTPYYGPDVAAFSPAQQAAFQNTAGAAGAFGLASPNDPYGGMGAPTDFGGVQGYSSAPLYQQSVDALAANRPGQKQYIDSFFIDPMTGQAGAGVQPAIDYTAYNTAAQDARNAAQADRANDLAIAQAQAGAGPETVYYDYNNETYNTSSPANTYITNPSAGITDTSQASALDGMRSDLNEAIIGNTVGLFNPTYKAGAINNPIANPTVAEMVAAAPSGMDYSPEPGSYIREPSSGPLTSSSRPPTKGASSEGGYSGISDMFDGGGPGQSGGAFSGGGVVSGVGNAATGGDGPGGDKVICTALHELGRLSDDVYALDAQFGLRVNNHDPMLGNGYRVWATSVANYIKGDSIGSKVALAIVSPVAKAWAAEMAHVMRPDEYKPNVFGKALMAVGHPICRTVGKMLLPKMKREAV